MLQANRAKLEQQMKDAGARAEKLEEELETNRILMDAHERDYKKIAGDPDRLHKQADKFASAVSSLEQQCKQVDEHAQKTEERLADLAAKKKASEESRAKSEMRLQYVKESVKVTTQSGADVKRRLERERSLHTDTVTKRVQLDMELKMVADEIRSGVDDLATKQKALDRLKRTFRKREMQRDSIQDAIPPLRSDLAELVKQKKAAEEELRRQKQLLVEIQAEVDLFIGAFLKQEGLSKEKKEQYDAICRAMEEMQKELAGLRADEQVWSQHHAFLTSQREKMAREASTAARLCREALAEVQMKALEEFDMKKKHAEITHRQKEFGSMYDIVKNERNKYVAMIQSSSQDLSEKKEKLKILQNEVEILRMESAAKDRSLTTTRMKAQRQVVQRDQLRTDYTRISTKALALNEQVGQFVIEIDKLNLIINTIEREMVVLKRAYEKAVEARNFAGIQLIDRNDELCILWEKSNIQEKLLKRGEDAMHSKDEEVRILRIELCEVQRKLQVLHRRIPDVPKLGVEVQRLRSQLADVHKTANTLSDELEKPEGSLRKWRPLPGTDPDQETLSSKIQFLEERLNDKKEALLEKELVLEEVTTLSEKLRAQALEGRAGTLELSQKVNAFQGRIKDVTRKMMATVSELSMYQATAIKLEAESEALGAEVERQRANSANGRPPYEDADNDLDRMLRQEEMREAAKEEAKRRREEEQLFLTMATRTTAEPRVNAYVPQSDDLGLPRAYGAHAPFMPTPIGSNARHIRKPQPKPVEI
jgi:chromosome segregation ATPase